MSDGTEYRDWIANHLNEFERWGMRGPEGAGKTDAHMFPLAGTGQALPGDDELLPDLTHLLPSPSDPEEGLHEPHDHR